MTYFFGSEKMRNKKIQNIILGILTFILIIYISISLTFLTLLNISKNYINKDKLQDKINNINISDIIKNSDEINNIKNELLDIGISNDSIDKLFSSEEVIKYENEVISNVIYDILNKENIEYRLDSNKLNEILYSNIDELKNTDKYNIIKNKIDEKIPILEDNINNLIDKLSNKLQNSNIFMQYKKTINKLLNAFDIIYSDIVNYLIIFVIISFIAMLMFIRLSIYKSLKWIGISFISSSLILYLFKFILSYVFNKLNYQYIFNNLVYDLDKYCVSYLVVAIVLIIINIIVYIIKKRRGKVCEA